MACLQQQEGSGPEPKPEPPPYQSAPVYRTYEQAEAVREIQGRRAIIAHYGSREAALAPCDRELALRASISRWTNGNHYDIRGCGILYWRQPLDLIPHPIIRALAWAVPLPDNVADARAEFTHWQRRNAEIQLLKEGSFTNDRLGPAGHLRGQIVRHLWRLDAGVDPMFPDELRAIIGVGTGRIEQAQSADHPARPPPPKARTRKPTAPEGEIMVLPAHVLERYGAPRKR